MPTMNVSLTPELADYVELQVSSGDYASASEVVRDALRMLRDEREAEQAKLQILKEAVQLGIDQADRGEFSTRTLDEIMQEVLEEYGAERRA